MVFIAFDPGITTGVAVISDDGSIVETYAIQDVDRVNEKIDLLADSFPDAESVAEEPPRHGGNYRPHTQEIEAGIKRRFPDTYWVIPGQWKGHPKARTSDLSHCTQHEKDAAGIGRWYRAMRRASVIPVPGSR